MTGEKVRRPLACALLRWCVLVVFLIGVTNVVERRKCSFGVIVLGMQSTMGAGM